MMERFEEKIKEALKEKGFEKVRKVIINKKWRTVVKLEYKPNNYKEIGSNEDVKIIMEALDFLTYSDQFREFLKSIKNNIENENNEIYKNVLELLKKEPCDVEIVINELVIDTTALNVAVHLSVYLSNEVRKYNLGSYSIEVSQWRNTTPYDICIKFLEKMRAIRNKIVLKDI